MARGKAAEIKALLAEGHTPEEIAKTLNVRVATVLKQQTASVEVVKVLEETPSADPPETPTTHPSADPPEYPTTHPSEESPETPPEIPAKKLRQEAARPTQLLNAVNQLALKHPDVLGSYALGAEGLSVRELRNLHKEMLKAISVHNAALQIKGIVYVAASGIEQFTSNVLKLKTAGFVQNIADHEEELIQILEEIAAKRIDTFDAVQSPEMRLAWLFANTLLLTELTNRARAT